MDRYIVREPRAGATYPQGNQNNMMAFSSNTGMSNIMPENIYYAPCTNQTTDIPNISPSTYMEPVQINSPFYRQNVIPAQGQIVTGIDPRYLANYCDNSAQYIVTGTHLGQQVMPGASNINADFGVYQNDCFVGANRNKITRPTNSNIIPTSIPRNENIEAKSSISTNFQVKQHNIVSSEQSTQNQNSAKGPASISTPIANVSVEMTKKEPQNCIVSKSDMLKALHKTGPRAFSGPIEKVLKWHKALQEIGVFVFYEIVAKCVSVRAGDTCSKNLVIRDENGPAMQVVYYEIDFLLSEIKIPSTVRVIGRMMPGTCRLQAFSVRPATGDDVAMLPRRAAVAAHHVAKLCKEYGSHTKN